MIVVRSIDLVLMTVQRTFERPNSSPLGFRAVMEHEMERAVRHGDPGEAPDDHGQDGYDASRGHARQEYVTGGTLEPSGRQRRNRWAWALKSLNLLHLYPIPRPETKMHDAMRDEPARARG